MDSKLRAGRSNCVATYSLSTGYNYFASCVKKGLQSPVDLSL